MILQRYQRRLVGMTPSQLGREYVALYRSIDTDMEDRGAVDEADVIKLWYLRGVVKTLSRTNFLIFRQSIGDFVPKNHDLGKLPTRRRTGFD